MPIRSCLLCAAIVAFLAAGSIAGEPPAPAASPDVAPLIRALAGSDAVAEQAASRKLVALGDAAVPALAQLAASPGPLAPRLLAVERLGEIRSPAAMDALLAQLRTEKDLAVRGQICMQLGHAREKRAVPVLAEGLTAMASRSLADVRGPKESMPSTCFIRHVEALEMIGDESAIPLLEGLAPSLPKITPDGFIRVFVAEAVRQAIENLRDGAAFWGEVRKHPGLEEKVNALFAHFRSSPLARLRLHENEVIRHTDQGGRILQRLTQDRDPSVAAAANGLLQVRWNPEGKAP